MGSDQWCCDTMGAKLTKQNRSDNFNKSQDICDWPENSGNTSTLPASFRRKGQVVSKTGSLPRNAGSQKFERSTEAGGSSIGQKIRKSCRNWALQKGLVQKYSKSANAGPIGETKPVNHEPEDNKKEEVVDDTNDELVKEDSNKNELDVGALVAALVVEAHKKKRASRALSKEALLDAEVKKPLNSIAKESTTVIDDSKERGTQPDDSSVLHQDSDATKSDVNIHNDEQSKHETNIKSLEQTEIIVKTNEDEKVNNLQSRENLDDRIEIENDNDTGLPANEVEPIETVLEAVETDIVQSCNESSVDTEPTSTQVPGQISNNEYETEHTDNNAVSTISESNNDEKDSLSNENISEIVEDIVEASMQHDDCTRL